MSDFWTFFQSEAQKGVPSCEWVKRYLETVESQEERDELEVQLKKRGPSEYIFSGAFYSDGVSDLVKFDGGYAVRTYPLRPDGFR